MGSLGVLSIVQAGAEEIPAPITTSPAATAPADDDISTPPPLMPWGAVPEDLEVAKPGTSSEKLADIGADVAPPKNPAPPAAESGVKGITGADGELQSTTVPAPPLPPGRLKAAPAPGARVQFHYAGAWQEAATDGTWAKLQVAKPTLDRRDAHTLAEIAVHLDDDNIVEVGWNVDRTVNGDDEAHLFVYYWSDKPNARECYNTCGFVATNPTIRPGYTLSADLPDNDNVVQPKWFTIEHHDGAWWVGYDTAWVGYFPDSLWDGKFTRATNQQWFGEVASVNGTPCTQMGNGVPGIRDGSAKISSISLIGGPPLAVNVDDYLPGSQYSITKQTTRTVRYGGDKAAGC